MQLIFGYGTLTCKRKKMCLCHSHSAPQMLGLALWNLVNGYDLREKLSWLYVFLLAQIPLHHSGPAQQPQYC